MRVAGSTESTSRSMMRSMLEAVRTTHAVVAESCGLIMMLTPLVLANAIVSSSISRLLVITKARMPSSIERRCTSLRSPTMMMDWEAGMFSFKEMLQKERMSMVPSRTKRSSTFSPSTTWTTRPFKARAMASSEVWTWRISRGSLTRGMKNPPKCVIEMAPTGRFRGPVTGSTRMWWRSINSRASAQVACSSTEMTFEVIRSWTRGETSLR